MPRRVPGFASVAFLLALCIASIGGEAAASATSTRFVDPPAPPGAVLPASPTAASCTQVPGAVDLANVWVVTPDVYTSLAVRFRPNSCAACPAPTAVIPTAVSFRVRWFDASSAQVEVSVIGASGSSGCLVPDPANVLCGPSTSIISSTGAGGVTYTLPFASGCCITGDAFVLIRFIGGLNNAAAQTNTPGINGAVAACTSCEQYYTTSPTIPTLSDWCPNSEPMWISIDANCCQPTPSLDRSWGGVKIFYR